MDSSPMETCLLLLKILLYLGVAKKWKILFRGSLHIVHCFFNIEMYYYYFYYRILIIRSTKALSMYFYPNYLLY